MIEIVITNYLEHLDPPEQLELSLEPDLGYPTPDPLFKTTVQFYHFVRATIEVSEFQCLFF